MKTYFREPQIEEGKRNLILQNRCGNRMTLLCHEDHCDVEFDYKPNAYRRKDYPARNFSNRDNHCSLFSLFELPGLHSDDIHEFAYDPFHTVLHTRNQAAAVNTIHLINIADKNCFAVAARCPLLIGIKPRREFSVTDGLLSEQFEERGEQVCSFVRFPGFEVNRYRVLEDGTHVLQLMENDVLYIGAEETVYLANETVKQLAGLNLEQLIAKNESVLRLALRNGRQLYADARWQRVFDLNQRIMWSGLDQGGACFGALNRIYHLIWVRDGSMTTNHMALAGNAEASRIWAPFLLANPSRTLQDNGAYTEEFLQIVGSRWTKSEDDGLFYAAWSLYTHFRCTGDDQLIQGDAVELLMRCAHAQLEKSWEPDLGLMGSDTLGEDLLAGNLYFGYDVVNGKIAQSSHFSEGRQIQRCYSLYHQVNTFNVLSILQILLAQRPDLDKGQAQRYAAIAERIQFTLRESFCDAEKNLYSMFVQYDDASEEWIGFGKGCDYWEHAWAVSQGPFYPVPDLQLRSARMVMNTWSDYKAYGNCPWNVLARSLSEFGLDSACYKQRLTQQIDEALYCAEKYPMLGALTEYAGATEGWRALPFSAGSFVNSTAAQLLQSTAQGLAVRGGLLIDAVESFQYRLSRINVRATGNQDGVHAYSINGQRIFYCLQIADNVLRAGVNEIEIERAPSSLANRIHGSNAELLRYNETELQAEAVFDSALAIEVLIDHYDASTVDFCDMSGNILEPALISVPDTSLTILRFETRAQLIMRVSTAAQVAV